MWGLGRCGLVLEIAEAAFFPTLTKSAIAGDREEILLGWVPGGVRDD
jgi:hypothetical protein